MARWKRLVNHKYQKTQKKDNIQGRSKLYLFDTEKESKYGKMGCSMTVNGVKIKCMVSESSYTLIRMSMKETF